MRPELAPRILVVDDDEAVRESIGMVLRAAGYGDITTEIAPLGAFYYAEPYHQQYLAKNPRGYCPRHATGVSCRI